jgi:hypothetical protein
VIEETPPPRPLQYASPRDQPQVWTASRILAGVAIVPAGIIIGLAGGTMIGGCLLSGPRSFAFGAMVLTFVLAVIFGSRAYETKLLMRLFFIGATIGAALASFVLGIIWLDQL